MKMLRTVFLLLFWLGGRLPLIAAEPESAQLRTLLDAVWDFDMREDPLNATRVGDHRYNDRLPDESLANQLRRQQAKSEFLQKLQGLARDRLSRDEQINYDILTRQLRDDIAEFGFDSPLIPITNRSGFHLSFAELPQQVPLNNLVDYQNYIARLQAYGHYTDQHVELMREGIRRGAVLPLVVLEAYRDPIATHFVDDVDQSLFDAPFDRFPNPIPAEEREQLRATGRAAITETVIPAYRRFLQFMESEYLPAARSSIGAKDLPQGREFYRHRVRLFTTLDISPEEVHETGQKEVARIRQEMEAIIAKVGFQGGFGEFLEFLRTDPKFYVTTPEQLQKEVSWILKRMDGELPRLFGLLPRAPYGLKEIPAYIAPRTTSAYYSQPAGDGSRAGYYYLNTFNLKSRPLFEMEALSLHEAVPGHHLQLAIQQELEGLPRFRRFTNFTAYIEGWALYAERLGLEVGFYQDPYSDFGRLGFEMWRACRLVVDTGMHYFGWDRERAIQFMATNTALSLHNVTSEVDRYISWPGQAVGYKIGELKIRELRRFAEENLGAVFDIREFHDVVLGSGSVPLTILEVNVQNYVANKKK